MATIRKPRVGEKQGVDYYFLERDDFLKRIQNGQLLEYNEYCGNFYGTLKSEVDRLLKEHEIVILEVDVNGVNNITKIFDCVTVFIVPPSLQILKERLLSRKTESVDTVKRRLKQACVELKSVLNYDYVVVNDIVSKAVNCFNSIFIAEAHKSFNMKAYLDKFLNYSDFDLV